MMKTTSVIKMDPRDPDTIILREVARGCRDGKLIIFPTETVYGIGGAVTTPDLQQTIAALKSRDAQKPLAFHIASFEMLASLQVESTPQFRYLCRKFWPGPLCLIVKNTSGEKIGIRFPRSIITAVLINATGVPFLATSANLSGQPSPTTAEEAVHQFQGHVDYVLNGGPTELRQDSTVVDLTGTDPVMVRRGAEAEAIDKALSAIRNGHYPRKKILIVCTGNSCRSPMAEGWLKKELKKLNLGDQIEVVSAGIGARTGSSATMEAVLVMKNREVDISMHKSRSCTREDILSSDIILAMGPEHVTFIQSMIPQVDKDKIKLLNIPDPIGMGMMIYEQVIDSIEKKLKACWNEMVS